jgi:NADH:ubiquinone oxidoreductase subunit 2 (subunit N)
MRIQGVIYDQVSMNRCTSVIGTLQLKVQPMVFWVRINLFALRLNCLAPFHKWTPDVYAGAPAPMATFLQQLQKLQRLVCLYVYFNFRCDSC